MNKSNKFKSQIATEYLVMMGLIIAIVIVTIAFTLRPQQDSTVAEAEKLANTIVSYANSVMALGAGNRMMVKVEIPSGISEISTEKGNLKFTLFGDTNQKTEVSQFSSVKISGFFDKNQNIQPGIYDLIFESYTNGVCVYTPNNRTNYCICFTDVENEILDLYVNILGEDINCTKNNEFTDVCNSTSLDLRYGDTITKFEALCKQNNRDEFDGYVVFTVTNRKNEVVYEGISNKKENGIMVLHDNYLIENSGELNFTATCYQRCAYLREELNELIAQNDSISLVPFGEIRPFLIDRYGRKTYSDITSNPYLINPTDRYKPHLAEGWVKSEDVFVVRTGYECFGGECLNVNASLWHDGVEP